MWIAREQRGSLLAFGCACVAHAGLVAWMAHVDRPRALAAAIVARHPSPAPLIAVPPPESTPIGEATGSGDAIAKVDLPNVAETRTPREIEQAWTRQKPTFAPPPPSEQASQQQAIGPTVPLATQRPKPRPPEVSPQGTVAGAKPEPRREETLAPQDAPPTREQVAAGAPKATPAKPDPAEAGPSDLDLFAKAEGVDFKPGGLEARTGRPVKLVRPRIDLGYMLDATALRGRKTTILLKIETDASGTPTHVDIVQSSGSTSIDDAIRLAMYSSHFGGKMPDAFPFGITLWQ